MKARSLHLQYCVFQIYTLSFFSPSHDLGETHSLHETLCEYLDVHVQLNGAVHGGVIVLSDCSVIFIIIKSFMCCLINAHVYSMYSKILYTKVSDKMAYANSVDPDQTALKEQSDQGLHCLPFH